jgi:ribosomal-protein-alanine N-acetyltransferase
MIVRPMEKDDIFPVLAMWKEIFPDEGWSASIIERELADPELFYYFVAEIDDKIIAYYAFQYSFDFCDFTILAVDKNYQQKGVGSILLFDAITRIKKLDCPKIILEVRQDNARAIQFYLRHGFNTIDIRHHYYKDGCDALIMEGLV